MLTQKQQTTPYIVVFKLPSGEEFITKVVDETATTYTVFKPLCMVPTEKGFQFAPLIMMGDIETNVILTKPVICATPNAQLLAQYESTISPIIMPQKGSIIT